LEKAGAQVVEVRTPMIDELATTHPVTSAEAYAMHAPWLAERLTISRSSGRFLSFAGQTARTIDAQHRAAGWSRVRAAVESVDVLVLATTRLRATHRAGRAGRRAGPPGAAGAEPAVQPVGLARCVGSGMVDLPDGLPASAGRRGAAGGRGSAVAAAIESARRRCSCTPREQLMRPRGMAGRYERNGGRRPPRGATAA
jgi:hypothetical protein